MSKKKKEIIESSSSLEEPEINLTKQVSDIQDMQEMQKQIDEMKLAHNGFVKAMVESNQKLDTIIQSIIRPTEPEPEIKVDEDGKPIKQDEKRDPRSDGILQTMNKKIGESTLGEMVQAGDLALRVHDRRAGLTDLEEFMVDVGKQNMIGFGAAQSHKLGTQQVQT